MKTSFIYSIFYSAKLRHLGLPAREQQFAYARDNQRNFDILLVLILSVIYGEFEQGLFLRFGQERGKCTFESVA